MHVAGEAIQLGNEESGSASPAFFECRDELRPIYVTFAAFDLLELGNEQGSVGEKFGYSGALGFKS